MSLSRKVFGTDRQGNEIECVTLRNLSGMQMEVLTYGGIIKRLCVPDRNANSENIVLGFDTLESYLGEHPYFGAIIGRFANRISEGHFELGDTEYALNINDGENHLHGGMVGFDKVIWNIEDTDESDSPSVTLSYLSPNGDENYPGNLNVKVQYSLTEDSELLIQYDAVTDQSTPVNLTNHSYFNLAGAGQGSILEHILWLAASHYTPVSESLMPTGEIASVEGTPYDFLKPKAIGKDIKVLNDGYDHNFIIDSPSIDVSVASVYDPLSGRKMEVFATQPGMQLYTSNMLEPTDGADGKRYGKHSAFCLETQHYPDSVNIKEFPSVILNPEEKYSHTTKFRFSAE